MRRYRSVSEALWHRNHSCALRAVKLPAMHPGKFSLFSEARVRQLKPAARIVYEAQPPCRSGDKTRYMRDKFVTGFCISRSLKSYSGG